MGLGRWSKSVVELHSSIYVLTYSSSSVARKHRLKTPVAMFLMNNEFKIIVCDRAKSKSQFGKKDQEHARDQTELTMTNKNK